MKMLTPELKKQWEEARKNIPVNRMYRHYKGGIYTVTGLSFDCETLEPVVEYQNHEHGTNWVRKASSWLKAVETERHEFVDAQKIDPNFKGDGWGTKTTLSLGTRFQLLGIE